MREIIRLKPRAYKLARIFIYIGIIIISLNWLLSLVPVYRRPYTEVTDPVLTEKINNLKKRANFHESITVRRYWTSANDNFSLWSFRDHDGQAIIFVDGRFSGTMPDDALSVVLAHEIGHLALGHCPPDFKTPDNISELDTEIQADAFALKIVGKDVFLSGFTKLMGSYGILVRSPKKRLEDAEMYNKIHNVGYVHNRIMRFFILYSRVHCEYHQE